MDSKNKIGIEVMYKKYDCLICSYMEEAVHEIMPAYQDYMEYKRVDIADSDGKERFLELSLTLFGEDGVYNKLQIAPIPSIFIDGRLFFETIPPRPLLEKTIEGIISEHFPESRYGKNQS